MSFRDRARGFKLKTVDQHGGRAARGPRGVEPSLLLTGQRRQLTVMFCDLVGSTELTTRLDPEDMNDLIQAYLRCCTVCIDEAGGFVARYMGDGVLAYFGYPLAHEDDPARALQASLTIIETARKLPTSLGAPLAVRAGVATGLVVVGDQIGSGPAAEHIVVGEAANLAARLQGAAAPNRVLASDATRRLAVDLFEFRELGSLPLKGLSLLEPVWEVIGPNTGADRFRARQDMRSVELVGREAELATVLDRWRLIKGGQGRLIGLVGEPGIGKSRLANETLEAIARQPHLRLQGGGVQVFRDTPFYAVSQMIRRLLGSSASPSGAGALARLKRWLRWADQDVERALPLVAELAGVPGAWLRPAPGDQGRDDVISTLVQWCVRSAARRPLLMVVEDLHWVDPSTLEFLDRLVREAASAPVLILYTTRDGAVAPWPVGDTHDQVALGRLSEESMRRLVREVADNRLSAEVSDRIASRAEGVPLFGEELTRLTLERNDGAVGREIPSTLSGLLMARLDQLGSAKAAAQIASVLGGEFHAPLLAAVSGLKEAALARALEALTAAGVLARRGPAGDRTYAFRHSLIQDTAYEALLKSQRRRLHRRAAEAVAMRFPQVAVAQPWVLARHWTGADETDLAVSAWQAAARSASDRSAHKEAQQAYEQATALLAKLPASAARDERELELQSALAGVLQITRGYSSAQTMATTARARALAESRGDIHRQFAHVAGAWMAASSAGDYDVAREIADQLLSLALIGDSLENLGAAHMIRMTSLYRKGELVEAEAAFLEGRPYFRSAAFRRRPGAVAQTFGNAAVNAWIQGKDDEARLRTAEVLRHSRTVGQPYELAFALYMAAMQAVLMSEPEKAARLAARSIRLSDEHEFPQFAATARVVLGRARAGTGAAAEGVELIGAGLLGMEATRSRAGMTMYLTWLAEAQALGGETEAALATVRRALQINPQEQFFRPESLRLSGELRRRLGDAAGAKSDCSQALALAEAMGAKCFRQRALDSLTSLRG